MSLTPEQIAHSHEVDDLLTANARLKKALRDVEALLEVLPHALDNGRLEVVDEYVDRSLAILRKTH